MSDTDLAALLPGIRERHDLKGHSRSSTPGYCAEPNGLTAVWCDIGALLAMVDAHGVRVGDDGLRAAAQEAFDWMDQRCWPEAAQFAGEGHGLAMTADDVVRADRLRDALRAALAAQPAPTPWRDFSRAYLAEHGSDPEVASPAPTLDREGER